MVLLVVGFFVAAAGALSVGGVVAYLFVGRSSTGPAASTVPARGPAPAPAYVAAPPPGCRFVRERYWDGYDWRFRRVEVCN